VKRHKIGEFPRNASRTPHDERRYQHAQHRYRLHKGLLDGLIDAEFLESPVQTDVAGSDNGNRERDGSWGQTGMGVGGKA